MKILGWIPDHPDHRDLLYPSIARRKVGGAVDLRRLCPPIWNQGLLSSCTAHALAGALGVLERRDGLPGVDFSRLFIYWTERSIEGTTRLDCGAQLRDGIKALARWGAPAESSWPYRRAKLREKPSPPAWADAARHAITSYHRIETLSQMLHCLDAGFPFAFGISVFESFEGAQATSTGEIEVPSRNESLIGGHALLAIGYDSARQRILFRNSWGKGWGADGYGTLPYEYAANRGLCDDCWTIRRGGGL